LEIVFVLVPKYITELLIKFCQTIERT